MKKMLFLIFLLAGMTTCSAALQPLPTTNNYNTAAISTFEEQELGKQFISAMLRSAPICNDAEVVDYINSLGNRLVANAGVGKRKFHFFVVNDNTINAFAGPDGYIGVNSGLILATRSESELASVLSHEISHVRQHHVIHALQRAKSLNIQNIAILLAAVALGSKTNSEVGMAAASAVMAGEMQSILSFSRSNEAEADRIGMGILSRSGFDPMAMPDFFARMQQLSLDYDENTLAFLRTHPVTSERIADSENRAKQYPTIADASSKAYYLMNARIRAITTLEDSEVENYFNQNAEQKNGFHKEAQKYGQALVALRKNEFKSAESILSSLINNYPDELTYKVTLAEVKTEANDLKDAIKVLQPLLISHGNYYPLVVQYSLTLIRAKQAEVAYQFLRSRKSDFPDESSYYILFSQAAGKANHLNDAYHARAKVFELLGEDKMAKIQNQQALKTAPLT